MSSPPVTPAPQRVAVIVVHGVADQAPFDSVRQVASMLANVDEGQAPAYASFTEHPIRVPVRRVVPPTGTSTESFFYASRNNGIPVDHRFTEAQLSNYEGEGPGATYDTIRLSTVRNNGAGSPAGSANVDVFEMYWADLSRVGGTATRILGELYQVLLHVGSIGKHAASASVGTHAGLAGRAFRWTTAAASLVLASPIAIFNAFFLVSAVLVLASIIPTSAHLGLSVGIAAAFALVVVVSELLRSSAHRPYRIGLAILGVIAAAGAAGYAMFLGRFPIATRMLGAEVLILAAGGVGLMLNAYRRRRPKSEWVSIPGGLLVLWVGVVAIANASSSGDPRFPALVVPGMRIAEALFIVLHFAWILFLVLFWASLAAGAGFWRGIADPARREAAKRAVWTARITLVIPAAAFLLITIALWSGLSLSFEGRFTEPYRVSPITEWFGLLPNVTSGSTFIEQVLVSSLGPSFVPAAALMTIGALLAFVALAPIFWAEIFPPATNAMCAQFGAWLTSGFSVLKGSGRLMVAAFVVWPVLAAIEQRLPPAMLGSFGELSAQLVGWLGLAVAVPAAGLIAFRGSLDKLAGGFRGPVDVLLDVDGYLREHPRTAAPRARVFARYYSLLQHIARADQPYSKVVVIAHSQGTVITADLFRYLKYRNLWPLEDTAVTLFTMGSPLRQLYARRFPELYEWVWHDAGPIDKYQTPDIPDDCKPVPSELGVTRWVNAYRSGDYVGRWLWRPDVCSYQFNAPADRAPWTAITSPLPGHSHDKAQTRRELCVGAGGHTHYWDGTAPEVALEMDLLIRT